MEKINPENLDKKILQQKKYKEENFFKVELYRKAVAKMEKTKIRQIKMSDFADDVNYNKFKKDNEYVKERKAGFANERTRETVEPEILGRILETIIAEQIKNLLGKNSIVQKTTDLDDIANGVDLIAEVKEELGTNHMGLSIDATHGKYGTVSKKLSAIKDKILKGELSTIEYFSSSDKTFQGRLRKVPSVVVGLDKDKLLDLIDVWVNGSADDMKNHYFNSQLVDEMLIQLKAFQKYAIGLQNKQNKDDDIDYELIVDIFGRQIAMLNKIKSQKNNKSPEEQEKELNADFEHYKDDRTYNAIVELTKTEK